MKTIQNFINESKLKIYVCIAKQHEECWAIVAADNLNSSIEICKSSFGDGDSYDWNSMELPELNLSSFRKNTPGIITSRNFNRPNA